MSAFKDLITSGKWDSDLIKYAFQAPNTRGWIVVFKKGTGLKNTYVGHPGEHFQPVKGRDKVRSSAGKLVPYEEDEQLDPGYNQDWYEEKLVAYPLDHKKQKTIILPESFDVPIQIIGAGPLGLQISLLLAKSGAKGMKICDPEHLAREDVALGLHRSFDPHRPKAIAAEEIIMNHTLQKVTVQKSPDLASPIIIQTSEDLDLRKAVWEQIKENPVQFFMDVQMCGERGFIYAITSNDEIAAKAYETALAITESQETGIAYMTSILGGFAAGTLKRYIRGESIDSFYPIDANILYAKKG